MEFLLLYYYVCLDRQRCLKVLSIFLALPNTTCLGKIIINGLNNGDINERNIEENFVVIIQRPIVSFSMFDATRRV